MKQIKPNSDHGNLFKNETPPFIMQPTQMPRIAKTGAKLIEIGHKPIHLNNAEFEILSKINKTNYKRPDLTEFLNRKGIPFGNGFVHIKLPNKPECLMNTSAEDFGTRSPLKKPKNLFTGTTKRSRF